MSIVLKSTISKLNKKIYLLRKNYIQFLITQNNNKPNYFKLKFFYGLRIHVGTCT